MKRTIVKEYGPEVNSKTDGMVDRMNADLFRMNQWINDTSVVARKSQDEPYAPFAWSIKQIIIFQYKLIVVFEGETTR